MAQRKKPKSSAELDVNNTNLEPNMNHARSNELEPKTKTRAWNPIPARVSIVLIETR
jgi:hypothetical protein